MVPHSFQRSAASESLLGSLRLLHFVAQAPDYLQVAGTGGINFDFLPEMTDVDGYCVLTAQGGVVPHLLIDLGHGEYLAGMTHQQPEDIEFQRRQVYRLPVHRHHLCRVI